MTLTVRSDGRNVPAFKKQHRWRRESRMRLKCLKIIFSSLLITSVFASRGIWQKRDIEGRLISEMA